MSRQKSSAARGCAVYLFSNKTRKSLIQSYEISHLSVYTNDISNINNVVLESKDFPLLRMDHLNLTISILFPLESLSFKYICSSQYDGC